MKTQKTQLIGIGILAAVLMAVTGLWASSSIRIASLGAKPQMLAAAIQPEANQPLAPAQADNIEAEPPVDPLKPATDAYDRGELGLAEHYCLQRVRAHVRIPDALGLMLKVQAARGEDALAKMDAGDVVSIRQAIAGVQVMLAAVRAEVDQIIQADLEDSFLSEQDREAVYQIRKQIESADADLLVKRDKAFSKFASRHIEEAKRLFAQGKGAHWYSNDDEDKFIEALVELNTASCVLDDLTSDERAAIATLHSTLKSELNSAQYEDAMERSRLILSPAAKG